MKKAIPLFLLCIFLFNTVGYFIAFKAVQYNVKKEIKSQIKLELPIEELDIITINKKDIAKIEWKEFGKEMFYNNELYDIVKSTETTTTIIYSCINDKKEKLLFVNLDEHVSIHIATDKPVKNAASKKLVDHVVKLYFFNEHSFLLNRAEKNSILAFIQINYTPTLIEINSPPPEFV